MQMGRRRDDDRLDPLAEQRIDILEGGAVERVGDEIPLAAVRIGHSDEFHAGHVRKHSRMVATHDANAYDTDPQFVSPHHVETLTPTPTGAINPSSPLARPGAAGDRACAELEHILIPRITIAPGHEIFR
jgi:hypothetical protein